jgi:hypothetical protein
MCVVLLPSIAIAVALHSVVQRSSIVEVSSTDNRGSRRAANGGVHKGIFKRNTSIRQEPFQFGHMRHAAHYYILIVRYEQKDIGRFFLLVCILLQFCLDGVYRDM